MIAEYVYVCHNCGREIWRNYWDEYAYKKQVPVNKKQHKTAYFCGWNCMREYERKKRRRNNVKKIRVCMNLTTGSMTDRGFMFGSECIREYDFDSHDFVWSNGMFMINNEQYTDLLLPVEKLNYMEVVDEDTETTDT